MTLQDSSPVRILVLDDVEDWGFMLKGLLEDWGYQVQTANSSESALKYLDETHFDLAIFDVRLDEPDEQNYEGIKLLFELRDDGSQLPVIILTGYPKTFPILMTPRLVQDRCTELLWKDSSSFGKNSKLQQAIERLLAEMNCRAKGFDKIEGPSRFLVMKALDDAFGLSGLRGMIRKHLIDPEKIFSDRATKDEAIEKLIDWSNRCDRQWDVVQGAYNENNANNALNALKELFDRQWTGRRSIYID